MSFSPAQQGRFQPQWKKAWGLHCTRNGIDPASPARRAWYEAELELATGSLSTTACDPKRDFEKAMAHFEAICGDSIYWNQRLYGADARRIMHEIQKVAADFDCDENYLQAMAMRGLKLDRLPALESLSYGQLLTIMGELKRHVRRSLQKVEEPF